ncbi:MAG: deoxyribose-phosphate aldolase [Syntrophothermus sp.]
MERLSTILSLLDLTTLEGSDNISRITGLCEKAKSFREKNLPSPAAVCVYPTFVRQAKKELEGSGIRVASVAGAFPSAQSPLPIRVAEVKFAVEEGADEIDMVISRGRFLEGDTAFVHDEISAIKKVCGNSHLKVILETGELQTPDLIRLASEIAIRAGADFIKTSTGKILPAATLEAAGIMLQVIKDHFLKTNQKIGFKPAGGISDPATALQYFDLVKRICGDDWLNPKLFRIGASRLADALVKEILAGNNK